MSTATSTRSHKPHRGSARRAVRWKIAGLALLIIMILAVARTVDVSEHLQRAQGWVGGLGAWGPVAYIGVYVAATSLAVPGLPFTLAAPLLFGSLLGFGVMVIASSLSAAGAFLVARHLARAPVERHFSGNETFAKVNRLLDQHAWIIIPFLRIVPVPFALNNYGFGLTSISFWRYLLWSEMGMIPMNAVLVLGADSLFRAAAGRTSWPLLALLATAAVIALTVAIVGRRTWVGLNGRTPPKAAAGRGSRRVATMC